MKVRRAVVLPVLCLAAASSLVLSACGSGGAATSATGTAGSGAAGTLDVVASTNVWGDVVKQIGGDHVRVTSFISDPDADPHSYEANAQNQLVLSKAQLVVENGGGYDDFVGRMLKASKNTGADVIDAVEVSGKKAPSGGELNEHVWYDFGTVKKVAARIADSLAEAEPANAATFRANAATFDKKVDTLQSTEAAIKADHHGEGVGITEPVPLYMLENAGLVNKTPADFSEAVEEGDDASVAVLNETLKLYSTHAVKALVYNEQTSDPQTKKVLAAAKSADVPAVGVTETLPAGEDYISWMTSNLDHVRDALSK